MGLKEIPGYDKYFADQDGNIYSKYKSDVPFKMKSRKTNCGYLKINFGKHKDLLVHRLVLGAFSGEIKKDLQCNHKNGIRSDNRIENLEWVTKSQNEKYSYTHLNKLASMPKGEQSYMAKLKNEDIYDIINLRRQGMTLISIGRKYNICEAQVHRIVHGQRWKHLQALGI